ncbi:Glutathione S-transferase Mu 3 [Saguinus oedipus]|uniref:glutathione transferase n=1 Tax=Saguinus oedipus TaxID=9490 RepID=A0ABQ9W076_SAGOE|nr:Glutathione S-transferase Mu 3 [Saguinus oedipus]
MVLGYWDIRGLAHTIRLLLQFTDTSYKEKRYMYLDFPNLPYLLDGKNKITQSNAILRYIAHKHNMCGETEEEKIRVDTVENQVMDFRIQLIKLWPRKTEASVLGTATWTTETILHNRIFEPKCLDEFPNLKAFMCRLEVLEKIAAYIQSDNFFKMPINNKMAQWGNKPIC